MAYLSCVYIFLFLPALLVVVFSVNDSRFWAFPLRGFSWRWYKELLRRPDALEALWNSILVATPTTVISVAFGTTFVMAFHRRSFSMKPALEGLVLLPLLIPSLIWTIALLTMLTYFAVPLGAGTVILGHVLYTTPFVVLLVATRLRSLDPTLEDAARSLGGRTRMILRRIVMPHLAPALVASGLISFATSFSDLVASFFLGGGGFNTLPVFIYSLIQFEPSPLVNSLATLIFAVGVLCILAALLSTGRDVITPGESRARGR